MKNILIIGLIFLLPGCWQRTKVISGLEGKPLPDFDLLLLDSTTKINTHSISKTKPFVLFYLNPNCPYCRAQTNELTGGIKDFDKVDFYLVSRYPLNKIKNYNDDYKLSKFPNVIVGKILDTTFEKYFKIQGVPYMAIYNKNKTLNEVMLGKVSSKDIITSALQEK